MQRLRTGLIRLGLIPYLLALLALPASAQVVLDGTLRPELDGLTPPVVPSSECALLRDEFNRPIPGTNYLLPQDAGITSTNGRNLFHSFRDLSLALDECLTFTGSDSVQSLIARVTGGAESLIQGILRSELPNADLFLVNPAGIRLVRPQTEDGILGDIVSVPGSFYASTADYLAFSDGEQFAVHGTQSPVDIQSEPAAWGFLGGGAAGILAERTNFLAVPDGERIGLTASDIHITQAAKVIANGGEIHLAAVGQAATEVPLDLDGFSSASTGAPLGEIRIDGNSEIKAGTAVGDDPMGRVVVRGGRLVIDFFSIVQAGGDVEPGPNAVDVEVAGDVEIRRASQVYSVSGSPPGPGGLRIEAGGDVAIRDPGTRVESIAAAGGSADPMRIEGDEIVVTDGAWVRTRANDVDRGGDLVLEGDRIEVSDGALVESLTTGRARGGDVALSADYVEVSRLGQVRSHTTSSGRGGDVSVGLAGATRTLALNEGGQIATVTLSDAPGGDVRIRASESIQIDGSGGAPPDEAPSGIFARAGSGSPDVLLRGDAGSLQIETARLGMTGPSLISASSLTSGRSGVVSISESESILLIGDERGAPEIATRTLDGNGGGVDEGAPGLVIETESLELRNGAAIASSTRGRGQAADIRIDASRVVLEGLGATGQTAGIFAGSLAPDAISQGEGRTGRIVLDVDRVEVLEGAELSIETDGPGEGQSIEITASDTVRIAGGALRSNASPLASARAGDLVIRAGNRIEITDGGLVSASSERTGSDLAPDAGDIVIEAGNTLYLVDGTVETTADAAAGGRIALSAGGRIDLLESRVETSVEGGLDVDDAGDIDVAGSEVVVNRSEVLADAELGDGGNIRISADAYLQSADSIVRASSRFGLDGQILIEAPDSELVEQASRLPADFLDAAELLRSHCAARAAEQGSFVVRGVRGAPASPARPVPARMPLPGDARPGSSHQGDLGPDKGAGAREGEDVGGDTRAPPRELQLALSPVDCERLVKALEARRAARAETRR